MYGAALLLPYNPFVAAELWLPGLVHPVLFPSLRLRAIRGLIAFRLWDEMGDTFNRRW